MPRSAITCSGALRAMISPNCPGPKPSERSARVTAATSSRYSLHVSVRQSPFSFQRSAGLSPHLRTASEKMVQTVFPDTAASMAERSASTSTFREYTTRWWWGEPDLRSIAPFDRDRRRGRRIVGSFVHGPRGRRVQRPAGSDRWISAGSRRSRSSRSRGLGDPQIRHLAARAPVLLPRPPARHPGTPRDACRVAGDGARHAVRPALLAGRARDGQPDDPAQERGGAHLQARRLRPAAQCLPRPHRPPARRRPAAHPPARVRFRPRPPDLAGRGGGGPKTPALREGGIMIAPFNFLQGRGFLHLAHLHPGQLPATPHLAPSLNARPGRAPP